MRIFTRDNFTEYWRRPRIRLDPRPAPGPKPEPEPDPEPATRRPQEAPGAIEPARTPEGSAEWQDADWGRWIAFQTALWTTLGVLAATALWVLLAALMKTKIFC